MYYLLKPSPYIPLCLIYGHSTAYVEGNKVNISPGNAVDCTVGPTHIHCEHLEVGRESECESERECDVVRLNNQYTAYRCSWSIPPSCKHSIASKDTHTRTINTLINYTTTHKLYSDLFPGFSYINILVFLQKLFHRHLFNVSRSTRHDGFPVTRTTFFCYKTLLTFACPAF